MTPIAMPQTAAGVARTLLEIERVDYEAPEASGRQGGVQAGWPLWSARWEIDRVDAVDGDAWRGFVDRLRGRQRVFIGGDSARPFPRSLPMGFDGLVRPSGDAFDGAALAWAQDIGGDGTTRIALTGLPAGLVLAIGDYVGWRWDAIGSATGTYDRRAMVRAVAPAVASGLGAITVAVEPPIDVRVVPATAVAHLDRPAALWRQNVADTKLGPTGAGGGMAGGTIAAVQDLRR